MLPAAIQHLLDRILGRAGDTEPGLREAVFEYAARRSDGSRLPEPLRAWVDKTANQAYRATDAEVDGLRRAGYSDGMIFELTVAAAAGAAEMRLRRGLEALGEASR